MRMLLCVVALAACGGTQKPAGGGGGGGSGSGSGSEAPQPIAQTLLGFTANGYDEALAKPSKVYLEITDHNGSTQSYPIDDIDKPCERTAGNGTDIITAMRCDLGGTGSELRAVFRGTDIIVIRRNYTPADDPADIELSFREIMRIPVPPGSSVKPAT
jgi:hypothetical protein